MGILSRLFNHGKKPLDSICSSETMKGWKELERNDYGFKISYPNEWDMKYTHQGIEIYPRDNPHIFDPILGREVASPGVNITLTEGQDPNQDIVNKFVNLRPDGYEGYKLIKQYSYKLQNVQNVVVYEFQYGVSGTRFCALSLVAQRNKEMFDVTASGSCQDFDKYRNVIERIIFSFQLTRS